MTISETTPAIGHNQLRSIVERIVRLEEDKRVVGKDIKDVYAEAASNGHNPKALRIVVRKELRDAKQAADLAQLEAEADAMMAALGMI